LQGMTGCTQYRVRAFRQHPIMAARRNKNKKERR